MAKIIGNTTSTPNPQPDWNQTDVTKSDYIKNKPDNIITVDKLPLIPVEKGGTGENTLEKAKTTFGITNIEAILKMLMDDSTLGLTYEFDGNAYVCTGIGTATETDIKIASEIVRIEVQSIGNYAFRDCTNLTSVTIPNSVIWIGGLAFFACTNLTSVTIGNNLTLIGNQAFDYCSSLTSITVSENNQTYKDIDGNLYTKDGKTLTRYAPGKTAKTFTIPDSVTSIGQSAFSHCSSLSSVTIPDSVTVIGDSAFYYCRSLTSVIIPDSVTSIGSYAFAGISILDIYYTGTEEQWNAITIASNAFYYSHDVTIHYNS